MYAKVKIFKLTNDLKIKQVFLNKLCFDLLLSCVMCV